METDLGVDLLLRTPQGVSPTDAGRLLLDRARRLLADFDATRQAVRDFESDPAGEVHLVRPLARSLGSAADAVHRLCRETLQHLIAEGRWLTDLDDPGQAHRPAPPKGA
jgi:DNA-binding transcriptional LysR family regulator